MVYRCGQGMVNMGHALCIAPLPALPFAAGGNGKTRSSLLPCGNRSHISIRIPSGHKVYGGMLSAAGMKQARVFVAARSQKEAAQILGVSQNQVREYFAVSSNMVECIVASSKPGHAFYDNAQTGARFDTAREMGTGALWNQK